MLLKAFCWVGIAYCIKEVIRVLEQRRKIKSLLALDDELFKEKKEE